MGYLLRLVHRATKARLYGEDEEAKLAAQNVLCYVLLRVLELLHPFMPFITEEIWQALPHEGDFLIRAQWPEYQERFAFAQEENAMEAVKDAISAVRARRSEMNVPPSRKARSSSSLRPRISMPADVTSSCGWPTPARWRFRRSLRRI